MSRISKFAARDTGPSARIVGFFSHLRFNNLKLGVSEVETALTILDRINMSDPFEVRMTIGLVTEFIVPNSGIET